tara:strand:- start:493 stop:732 length:240 start_codon:yes stop_codon:yes gene_type:complete
LNNNTVKKGGDLVFIPSDVTLLQFSDNAVGLAVFITKHMKTDKPNQVLLLETGVDNYCKVLYNGEYWYAKEKDVYGVTL